MSFADATVINVINSTISGNANSGADVAGGIAIENSIFSTGTQTTQVTVIGSTISNNSGVGGTNGGGGIVLESDAGSALSLLVSKSTISNNQGEGVFALRTGGNHLSAIIDSSSVFGNMIGSNLAGLTMDGVGIITVTNPVYFDGVVNFSGGGVITFPNVTPSSGDTVVCPLNTGTCVLNP